MDNIKKILIAEDELLIAKVIRLQFEKLGHEVRNVISADDAVEVAKVWKPDVIILDIYLKNQSSGISAGNLIRRAGINSPIIFTTGNSYEGTLSEIKPISNSYLLIKPIEFEQLLQVMKKF